MWPVYVINLAANTERMAAVSAVLNGQNIPFSRIEGVNGWTLTEAEKAAVYDLARNGRDGRQPLVPAEIGCYLSHIKAWQEIVESGAPGGFVFEDDFAATPALVAALNAVSCDTARDWDMAKLFALEPSVRLWRTRDISSDLQIGIPYRVPTCLLAYALTREAASELISRVPPFFRPVDEDQKFVWETKLRVALVHPTPVILGNQQATTGTIGNARRAGKRKGFAQWLHALQYGFRYRAALARHRKREGWGQ